MLYSLDSSQCRNYDLSSRREWILTNGIGGFAMSTVAGSNTRRYHGHLVVADPAPAHRLVLLGGIEAFVQGEGNPIGISCHQYQGAINPEGHHTLESFSATKNWVLWRHRVAGMHVEKRMAMHPNENACTIKYTNTGSNPIALQLRPLVQHKFYHENFRSDDTYPHVQAFPKSRTIIEHEGRTLILHHEGAQRLPAVGWYYRFEYPRELERGLDGRDDLFCPCELRYELLPNESAILVASLNDETEAFLAWDEPEKDTSLASQLRDAAERFLVATPTRTSIIAGYPWFTDWGRDTMISIPGICLQTGRVDLARKIILDYAGQMNQGLIPNRFVDDGEEPEYNTVDATLWFANAIYKTLEAEWNAPFASEALTALQHMLDWHIKGTHYGIQMDPEDGLLKQGAEGVQLTWMDAKIGDWVVTPRHGKPIEVNGLWINALRVMEWLAGKLGEDQSAYRELAAKAESHFEKKFWKESVGYYLDTADPDDASLRPNQLIAMALPFGPAKGEKAQAALGQISRELLTPVGLRTLSPDDVKYRGRFEGPLQELDSAYHQGTVWPWLIGPYVSALVRLTSDKVEAKRILKKAKELTQEYGLGGIAEVYDGDEPRQPGGCPWQAWSVGEWLRAWVEDADGK
ncbi:MAG: glycogen debranching enzyme family protein [Chthonomonas sp.]|nr:glycogen debranching enzyme family protein [Chthonomonas sp.]